MRGSVSIPQKDQRGAARQRSIRARGEEGTATVEFALIFGFLMLLVVGLIDFGYVWHLKHVLSRASQEGARYGVLYRATLALPLNEYYIPPDQLGTHGYQTITQYVESSLGAGFVAFHNVTVTVLINDVVAPTPNIRTGDNVTVQVSANQNTTFLLTPFMQLINSNFQVITLSSYTTMKIE